MQVLSPNSAILEKTRELCELLLDSPEFHENTSKIRAFFSDDEAKSRYQHFHELSELLQQKQQAGELTDADINEYTDTLTALKEDSITGSFMTAEAAMNGIAQQISMHVSKTLEFGRLPTPEELEAPQGGCCGGSGGGSCGC